MLTQHGKQLFNEEAIFQFKGNIAFFLNYPFFLQRKVLGMARTKAEKHGRADCYRQMETDYINRTDKSPLLVGSSIVIIKFSGTRLCKVAVYSNIIHTLFLIQSKIITIYNYQFLFWKQRKITERKRDQKIKEIWIKISFLPAQSMTCFSPLYLQALSSVWKLIVFNIGY